MKSILDQLDEAEKYTRRYKGEPCANCDEGDDHAICYCFEFVAKSVLLGDQDNIRALIDVAKAAEKHVRYAKEKQGCGPCFEYCPNAVNGDAPCECGGSMLWASVAKLNGGAG